MSKLIKRIILSVIALLLITAVIYKLPYSIHKSYFASTVNGGVVQVSIDLQGYRKLFDYTNFRGSITVGEDKYVTFDYSKHGSDGFAGKMMNKLKGIQDYPTLILPDDRGNLFGGELLDITHSDAQFSFIYFVTTKDNTSVYYGPSHNAAEAKALQQEILSKYNK